MPLLIDNEIAAAALNMKDAISAMESALKQLAEGNAVYQPRTDLWSPTATVGDYFRWGSLLGAIKDPPILSFRFKLDILTWQEYNGAVTEDWFNVEPGKYCGVILLADMRTGELLCIMNDGYLQSYRVGATAGVGVKCLSRQDSKILGVLGSGAMARTYAMATCATRPIEQVKVFSPTKANRERYAKEMEEMLRVKVIAVNSPREAMSGADIAATCTDSRVPLFASDWLQTGMHVVDVRPEELESATYEKADVVVATSNNAVLNYALGTREERDRRPIDANYQRRYQEKHYTTLPEILTGVKPGRTSDSQTTLHHNFSAGIQFAAVGYLVYRYAKDKGLGRELPLEWFQQDIRN
jgi:alanine dehydrogenase